MSESADPQLWDGDSLDRKPFADYLTSTITSHLGRRKADGLTIALDADWGAGKSFFVRKWADDLRVAKHPVVYFDAWENDIGDEASVALMASILGGLSDWKKQLPKGDAIQAKAAKLRSESVKRLRRAVVPVGKVIASGLAKRVVGVGLEEVAEALGEPAPSAALKEANDTLDKLFEVSLKDHQTRQQSLRAFRSSLEELLGLIFDHTKAKLPLYVFVDELDRCRPSYAIKLLEEIKHIFGVKGVVYVVSTNILQLQNSVRAIYGTDFDGRRYLRRLFDREYSLPPANAARFIERILKDSPAFSEQSIYLGLPSRSSNDDELRSIESLWAMICDAYALDLRTQKQVVSLAEEAAGCLPSGVTLHAMWLFFLSALYQVSPESLRVLATRDVQSGWFSEQLKISGFRDKRIEYTKRSTDDFYGRSREKGSASLSTVLATYFELSQKSGREIFKIEVNHYDYPGAVTAKIQEEFGGVYHSSSAKYASIHWYVNAVLGAGHLVNAENGGGGN